MARPRNNTNENGLSRPDWYDPPMVRIGTVTLTNGTTLQPGNLTVLVGPNNGGKSRFLKDLVSAFGNQTTERKSVGQVERIYAGRYPLADLLASLPRDINGNNKLDVLRQSA